MFASIQTRYFVVARVSPSAWSSLIVFAKVSSPDVESTTWATFKEQSGLVTKRTWRSPPDSDADWLNTPSTCPAQVPMLDTTCAYRSGWPDATAYTAWTLGPLAPSPT